MSLLLFLACKHSMGSAKAEAVPTVADYAGARDTLLLFAPQGEPDGSPRMLRITEENWEFRDGDFWRNASEGAALPYTISAGLVVDGSLLLPKEARVGGIAEDATITEDGAYEGYYGTFPDTLSVEIGAGDWAGTAIFAKDIGLIRYSRGGDWELVYYELKMEDTGSLDSGD